MLHSTFAHTYLWPTMLPLNQDNAKQQMRKGVLELCILSIIAQEEVYPSDILQRLKEAELIVVEGTLYPLLTRLKNAGLVEYTWRESASGPPRKYFKITESGAALLGELRQSWQQLVVSVSKITDHIPV